MKNKRLYIKDIIIEKVRHLENIDIPVSDSKMKHLIITGKNGSGKTSLLNAIALKLYNFDFENDDEISSEGLKLKICMSENDLSSDMCDAKANFDGTMARLLAYAKALGVYSGDIPLKTGQRIDKIISDSSNRNFLVAYYRADRAFVADVSNHIEKVELKDNYAIDETPRSEFIKYMVDLKMTEALSLAKGNQEKANEINNWFDSLQNLLKKIFDDASVCLNFDEESFQFTIHIDGREPFDFNTLSSGYAAILDIVTDLMMRMEKHTKRRFDYSMGGIVLIDEIETHLHLQLQKTILLFLTEFFPNIQFIVSTHSPFVLSSMKNVTIYDLENRVLVENGLKNIPYSGIVKGYFEADELSDELKEKYERYQELATQDHLSDKDIDEITDLEFYLDEIPDYLALELTTEYQRLKLELRKREDIGW